MKVRAIKTDDYPWDEPKFHAGDEAELVRAEDYVPGLDAGAFDVKLSDGRFVSYWDRATWAKYWQAVA